MLCGAQIKQRDVLCISLHRKDLVGGGVGYVSRCLVFWLVCNGSGYKAMQHKTGRKAYSASPIRSTPYSFSEHDGRFKAACCLSWAEVGFKGTDGDNCEAGGVHQRTRRDSCKRATKTPRARPARFYLDLKLASRFFYRRYERLHVGGRYPLFLCTDQESQRLTWLLQKIIMTPKLADINKNTTVAILTETCPGFGIHI